MQKFHFARINSLFRLAVLLLAVGILWQASRTNALAQTAVPAETEPVDDGPGYATNAVFVFQDCEELIPFYLVTGLTPDEVLGKEIVVGTFFKLEPPSRPSGIAFLFTEDPSEFWFLTGAGLYGLVTIETDGTINWVDSDGNSGFIVLF